MSDDPFGSRRKPFEGQAASVAMPGTGAAGGPPRVVEFVLGRDSVPRPLTAKRWLSLGDPFAQLLRTHDGPLLTGRAVIDAVDGLGLSRESFVASDGGQIAWTSETADLVRQTRYVVAWRAGSPLSVLLATGEDLDDPARTFLQVIGWDAAAGHFNYYDRSGGVWTYAGNSSDALQPPTRGLGPFDSHVNGGLVMKELKAPWLHWSSQSAKPVPGIAPDSPTRSEALFTERAGAEDLEARVRSGLRAWTRARLDRELGAERCEDVPGLLRQVLTTTSVNIVTSSVESEVGPSQGDRFRLPVTAFLDSDTLLSELDIPVQVGVPLAPWAHYRRTLNEHKYALRDRGGRVAHEGDVHFAFLAPERAHEDVLVTNELVRRRVLSKRLLACLLMVDFPNPVYSRRREALMRRVPATMERAGETWDLEERLLVSILDAADVEGSAEAEFAAGWALGASWPEAFGQRIDTYLRALQRQLDDWAGYEAVARLMNARRTIMRGKPLLEFRLTMPTTNLPDVPLRMLEDATVVVDVLNE